MIKEQGLIRVIKEQGLRVSRGALRERGQTASEACLGGEIVSRTLHASDREREREERKASELMSRILHASEAASLATSALLGYED